MSDRFLIPFLILLLSIFIARRITEKASLKLSQEKKTAIVDLHAVKKYWSGGILISIILLYFGNIRFELISPMYATFVYSVFLTGYICFVSFYHFKQLKVQNFPNQYIKSYLIASSIRIIAFIAFILSEVIAMGL